MASLIRFSQSLRNCLCQFGVSQSFAISSMIALTVWFATSGPVRAAERRAFAASRIASAASCPLETGPAHASNRSAIANNSSRSVIHHPYLCSTKESTFTSRSNSSHSLRRSAGGKCFFFCHSARSESACCWSVGSWGLGDCMVLLSKISEWVRFSLVLLVFHRATQLAHRFYDPNNQREPL